MIRSHLFALPLLAVACAHVALPAEEQEAYFRCTVTLQEAEANLARAGFPIAQVGAASVTTQPLDIVLAPDTTILISSEDRQSLVPATSKYAAQFVVAAIAEGGVRFTLYMNTRSLEPIAAKQVEDEDTRGELNRMRQAVCGGEAFFH